MSLGISRRKKIVQHMGDPLHFITQAVSPRNIMIHHTLRYNVSYDSHQMDSLYDATPLIIKEGRESHDEGIPVVSQLVSQLGSQLVDKLAKLLYISAQPLAMAFYLLFLFPKNLEAHTTMALAHHPTPVMCFGDF